MLGLLVIVLCALTSACTTAAPGPVEAARDYRDHFAPDLLGRKEAIDAIAAEIETDPGAAGRADRYGAEVLPRLQDLLARVEAYRPPTARVAAAHEHAVAALRLAEQACADTIRAYRAGGDTALLAHARHLRDGETLRWRAWLDSILRL